jgi:RNA polymerase sigma factor (sigma-70 family)
LIRPDLDIWQAVLQGDKSSFEQLMERHYKALFHYAAKFSTDTELVKDCIQELFIGIWDSRARLSSNVNPRAYLVASLRRALHRKLQVESRISKAADLSEYFDLETSIEEKLIHSEKTARQAKLISHVVNLLPKRQKEVIYLKFFQDLSRDEIADIMGNSPQTVSNLLQLALKRLRTDIQYLSPVVVFLIIYIFSVTNSWLPVTI